jgi:hypothetical protein
VINTALLFYVSWITSIVSGVLAANIQKYFFQRYTNTLGKTKGEEWVYIQNAKYFGWFNWYFIFEPRGVWID